jgi:pSer/pThr/pTyr-binding forkhead associated (FHA) protein
MRIALNDGRLFPLEGTQITVGRSPDNIIVVNDAQVSGHHLIFAIQPEGVVVWDNNSTNGSYFNGQPLQGSQRLTPDDVLQIGEVTLRLVAAPPPPESGPTTDETLIS